MGAQELKAAQYVADLAAHHRDEDMKRLKAFNRRKEQETAWKDAREWEEKQAEAETKKANDQLHLFSEQRENKDAAKASVATLISLPYMSPPHCPNAHSLL